MVLQSLRARKLLAEVALRATFLAVWRQTAAARGPSDSALAVFPLLHIARSCLASVHNEKVLKVDNHLRCSMCLASLEMLLQTPGIIEETCEAVGAANTILSPCDFSLGMS